MCSGCGRNVLQCRRLPDQKSREKRKDVVDIKQSSHSSPDTSPPFSGLRGRPASRTPSAGSATDSDTGAPSTHCQLRLLPTTTTVAAYGSPSLRTATDYNLLAYYMAKVAPLMTRPYVHADYGNLSFQYTIALHQPIAMNVLLGCASNHLTATNSQDNAQAVRYYNSAIHELRRKIAQGEMDGSEDWLMLVTLSLGVFEVWLLLARIRRRIMSF